MQISIILPTYNEKDNIVRLVETIKKLDIEQTFEILIIDDNSPDGTYQFSKDKLSDDKNIKIVLRKNIRGTLIISSEGINGNISGKKKDLNLAISKIQKTFNFTNFDNKNVSINTFQPFHL